MRLLFDKTVGKKAFSYPIEYFCVIILYVTVLSHETNSPLASFKSLGGFFCVGMKKALLLVADVLKEYILANDFSSAAHKKALTIYFIVFFRILQPPFAAELVIKITISV